MPSVQTPLIGAAKRKPRHDERVVHSYDLCQDCRQIQATEKGPRAQVFLFFQGETTVGGYFEAFILSLIALNVLTFILGTEAEVTEYAGWVSPLFTQIENVSVGIFTIEYLIRLWCSAEDPHFNYSRLKYSYSFFALADLLAIVPFYIDLMTPGDFIPTTVVRIFRLFRMFKAEHYVESFTTFDNVYQRNKAILQTTGIVALIIWILSSAVFWATEKDNEMMEGAFNSIPDAMFYVAIFLGGEWAKCDFTVGGQFMGIFLCVVGIAIYSIPIGVLSSGFEEIATERAELQAERAGKRVVCKRCGEEIKVFAALGRLKDD